MKKYNSSILCFPGNKRSCFYCCPPIREPEYDPLAKKNDIHSQLVNNKVNINKNILFPSEIGHKCWGLGYLDSKKMLVGCLLHPSRNNEIDLRELTGYREKCGREVCLESRQFLRLEKKDAQFLLNLSLDMDSFQYSSRVFNPTFAMLSWGPSLLSAIAKKERYSIIDHQLFKDKYSMFLSKLNYKADSYLVERIVILNGLENFLSLGITAYQAFKDDIIYNIRLNYPYNYSDHNCSYIHKYPISPECTRFFKFGLNIWRGEWKIIEEIINIINKTISKLKK